MRERIRLAGQVERRPAEDLREEERTIVCRRLIERLTAAEPMDNTPSQRPQRHVVAELVGSFFENKRIFDHLHARKTEIEQAFGGTILWDRLDDKRACRVKHLIKLGGYRSPESQWPEIQSEMVDTMSRLEAALKPVLASLEL